DLFESKVEDERFVSFLADGKPNLEFILEAKRGFVVALGMDAGEGDVDSLNLHLDGETERAQVRVLGLLHVAEEIGEVHDSRHIRVGELNAVSAAESRSHCLPPAVLDQAWCRGEDLDDIG